MYIQQHVTELTIVGLSFHYLQKCTWHLTFGLFHMGLYNVMSQDQHLSVPWLSRGD